MTARFVKTGAVRYLYIAFAVGPSGNHEDLLSSKLLTKIQFRPKIITAPPLQRPAVFCCQAASQLHVFELNQLKPDHNDKSNFFKFYLNVFHLHLVLPDFPIPLPFLKTSLYDLYSATCPKHLDLIRLFFSCVQIWKT